MACTLAVAAAAWAGAGAAGSPGLGDPFFPQAGNGGYEVDHYGIDISYHPGTHQLRGREEIRATAKQDLDRFDLDLRGLTVRRVRVDGHGATFTRSGQELTVTPRALLASGRPFRVTLAYRGKPKTITDPDGSLDGWIFTRDGAWVASEPQGSPSWFAANDHPSDKARFDVTATVPATLKAVSNGKLVHQFRSAEGRTFHWRERAPMATYLATATIGRFRVSRSKFDGLRSYVAVDPKVRGSRAPLRKIPAITRFFSSRFGSYPFRDVGAIADPSPAGYALEIQTRPIFPGGVDDLTLAHELAHQWFGDSVSLEAWPDIWLNEGFATWSEWLWGAHSGGKSLRHDFADGYSVPASNTDFWSPPPADPGNPAHLFDGTIYERGAMTLEALRERIGSHDFFHILRRWAADHRHANATTQDFIDLAESISGQDLTQFFQDWLYTPAKPAGYKQASARVTAGSQAKDCPGLRLAPRSWNPCAQTQSPPPLSRR